MQRRIYGHATDAAIRPLNEEKAVQAAVDLLGELFVFTVIWFLSLSLPSSFNKIISAYWNGFYRVFMRKEEFFSVVLLGYFDLSNYISSTLVDLQCLPIFIQFQGLEKYIRSIMLSHVPWKNCRDPYTDYHTASMLHEKYIFRNFYISCTHAGCWSCCYFWGAKKFQIRSKKGGAPQARTGGIWNSFPLCLPSFFFNEMNWVCLFRKQLRIHSGMFFNNFPSKFIELFFCWWVGVWLCIRELSGTNAFRVPVFSS